MNTREEETRIGSLISGKYRVEERLGAGAVGEVFRARNVLIGREVAIKLLRREHAHNAELVERFLREAQAASRVRHPHVVEVIDVGLDDETPYIVQELLLGEDLGAHLGRKGGRLAPRAALALLLPAIDGVAQAHARGVVHRDLKPENIFLARTDDGVVPKVLDFGISKVKAGNLHAPVSGAIFGTPGYMAPEQVRAFADTDARADVWSLGVILYELLAGRLPFESSDATTLMVEVCTRPAKPLAEVAPEIPEALAAVVSRCLERAPADRFADASALAAALRELDLAPVRVARLQFVNASVPPAVATDDDGRVSLEPASIAMLQALPLRVNIIPRGRPALVDDRPWEIDLSATRGIDLGSTLDGAAVAPARPAPAPAPRPRRHWPVVLGLALAVAALVATLATRSARPAPAAHFTPSLRALTGSRSATSPAPAEGPAAGLAPAPAVPASPSPPSSPSSARAGSGLDASLRRAAELHQADIALCVAHARREHPAAAGSVTVRLTVAPDGRVRSAVPEAPRPLRNLGRCLAHAARAWQLGPTGSAQGAVVAWPFELPSP